MGLFSRTKQKIKISSTKRDGFSGWLKCTKCDELIHANDLEKNLNCCQKCDYHYRLGVPERIALLTDAHSYQSLWDTLTPRDILGFVDTEPYSERLKSAQAKSGSSEAVTVGHATLDGIAFALGVLDFSFMGGSMGSVVGEKLTRLIELALEQRLPLVIVSTSGGARMQESILSLMQMAKTSAALQRLHDAKIPYISILTNPTTGGVTASFASLGDIIIAEPNALICFAGPRVIEQTIKKPLPPGAQQSEFLMKHGMIDAIVPRSALRKTVGLLLTYATVSSRPKNSHNTL